MNENKNHKDTFEKLSAPFHPDDLEWRAGATNGDKSKALALAYITSRAVMDRLDEVIGPENWRDEYQPGPVGGLICGISLRINGEWITKWDGAENTTFEPIKGGLSDAFKRSAVKWSIGRYLYRLPNVWVPCEAKGKNVVLRDTPKLPSWALPDELSQKSADKPSPQEREKQILQELGFDNKEPEEPAKDNGNGSKPNRRLSWGMDAVQAVIQAGIASSPPKAVLMLNQSSLDPDSNPEEVVTWFKEHNPV